MTVEERVDSICKWQNAGLRDLVIQEMYAAVEEDREIIENICDEEANAMSGVFVDAGSDYTRAARASSARDMANKIKRRVHARATSSAAPTPPTTE